MCMKKIIALSCLLFLCSFAGHAQKFALIDMEYILKNIPAYEMTNEQLSQVSKKCYPAGSAEHVQDLPERSCISVCRDEVET